MRTLLVLLAVSITLVAQAGAADEDFPWKEGVNQGEFEGLRYRLEVPADFEPEKEHSLMVALHGAGSNDAEYGSWFEPLVPDGFIVCAPKSKGTAWTKSDIDRVKKLVLHLTGRLNIGAGRLHGAGFSNGGAHLGSVVFEPKLPFATACWMGSGFTGGRVSKRAKKEMAVLALAGEKDPAAGAARKTPDLLRKKVRFAEFREQPGLGHEIPDELMPYYYRWLMTMEGRYEPGEDLSFDWHVSYLSAQGEMKDEKKGGLLYFYSLDDEENEDAKRVEHEVFFDGKVRELGNRLVAAKLEAVIEAEAMKEFGLSKTPAIVVLRPDGTVVGKFTGKFETVDLVAALAAAVSPR